MLCCVLQIVQTILDMPQPAVDNVGPDLWICSTYRSTYRKHFDKGQVRITELLKVYAFQRL